MLTDVLWNQMFNSGWTWLNDYLELILKRLAAIKPVIMHRSSSWAVSLLSLSQESSTVNTRLGRVLLGSDVGSAYSISSLKSLESYNNVCHYDQCLAMQRSSAKHDMDLKG